MPEILKEVPALPPDAWKKIDTIPWDAPTRAHYGFPSAIQVLRESGNAPKTATELFGEEPRIYRNGPEKMNEILRTSQVPYRLRRIARPGRDEFHCDAAERLFVFAPE